MNKSSEKEKGKSSITYQVGFNHEENDFIQECASKKKLTEQEYLKKVALGKLGNKRLRDKQITEKATDLTFYFNKLKNDYYGQESQTEIIKDLNYLGKELLELCQI